MKIYGVGTGPGDPELITLKALRIISTCEVLALPAKNREKCRAYQIVRKVMPEIDNKDCIFADFPMSKDEKELENTHHEIFSEIIRIADGRDVAFLTIGDPSLYSTFTSIRVLAEKEGLQTEMVSGVTSFCAAAARLGISLGDGNAPIQIIPGYNDEDFTEKLPGTKIYMKTGKKLSTLKKALEKHREGKTYWVSNCGFENEKKGSDLDSLSEEESYMTTIFHFSSKRDIES